MLARRTTLALIRITAVPAMAISERTVRVTPSVDEDILDIAGLAGLTCRLRAICERALAVQLLCGGRPAEPVHDAEQCVQVVRFTHDLVCKLGSVPIRICRCRDNDGDGGQSNVSMHRFQHSPATHDRHHQVQEHEARAAKHL